MIKISETDRIHPNVDGRISEFNWLMTNRHTSLNLNIVVPMICATVYKNNCLCLYISVFANVYVTWRITVIQFHNSHEFILSRLLIRQWFCNRNICIELTIYSKTTVHLFGKHLVWLWVLILAPTQTADNVFHSFTVLCENENVLLSSIHCFFASIIPYYLVLLSSLTETKYSCQYFHTHSIF